MKVTFLGHSSFLWETANFKLVFDPFITANPAAQSIDASQLEAHFILLSHAHFDHVADVELLLEKNPDATIIANAEIAGYYAAKGVKNTHGMNSGGKFAFPFGEVRLVQAIHSSTFPDGSGGGNPNGFIITIEGKTIYYSGDTALFGDMKLYGERYKPEIGFLCMGDNYTMGIDDASLAAHFIGTKKVIGMHFDTMPLIAINHQETQALFTAQGVELILPVIGESFYL